MKFRNIIGYLLGICIFLLFLPYVMYLTATLRILLIYGDRFISCLIALPFIIVGLIFMFWSNTYMAKIGKGNPADGFNVAIGERTKNLMVAGPYKYSRNPMLFGTFVFYIGIGFILNSLLSFIVPILFISYMSWHVSKFEEPRLQKDFGAQYTKYKKTVSKIIPWRFLFL